MMFKLFFGLIWFVCFFSYRATVNTRLQTYYGVTSISCLTPTLTLNKSTHEMDCAVQGLTKGSHMHYGYPQKQLTDKDTDTQNKKKDNSKKYLLSLVESNFKRHI